MPKIRVTGTGGGAVSSVNGHTGAVVLAASDVGADASGAAAAVLPSQTGNSGKYLTTNGSTASWGTVSGGSLTSQSNMISADVTMTTAGTYYDGPTLTLAAGTYLLIGSVACKGSTAAVRTFNAKLWDGTNTAVASAQSVVSGSGQAGVSPMPVAAIVTPVGSTTYKISANSNVNSDLILGTGAQTSYLLAVKIG